MKTYTVNLKEQYPFLGENGCDPVLDAYIQDNPFAYVGIEKILRPAMLVLPGGGYQHLCPREGEPFALEFSAEGYQTFVLNYSVAPNKYPTQLLEVAASIDYIVTHCEELSVDVDKIVISGFSAGGHLASSYCTMAERPEITEKIKPTKPAAAVLAYPVITATGNTHKGTFQALSGHENLTDEEIEKYSSEKHVCDFTPPTFIFATSEDNAVPVRNSLLYANALAENGILTETHIYPFGPHGMSTAKFGTLSDFDELFAKYASTWINDAKRFLKQILGY